MRRLGLVLVLVALAACGDDDDPYRFEVSNEEWKQLCPNDPWRDFDEEVELPQFFRANGTPVCRRDPVWTGPFCVRFFGGNLDYITERTPDWQNCDGGRHPIVCHVFDADDPWWPNGVSRGEWPECVSLDEAKRRSL